MIRERFEDGGHRKFAVLFLDICVSVLSSLLAVLLMRWQTAPMLEFGHYLYVWVFMALVFSLLGFLIFGTNRIMMRHSTMKSIGKLTLATLLKELLLGSCLLLGLLCFGEDRKDVFVLISDLLITLVLLIVVRVIIISLYEDLKDSTGRNIDRIPVLVYGVSDKSVALVIRLENSVHYNVLGFLTRDKSRNGMVAQDRRIYAFETQEELNQLKINLGFTGILFSRDEDAEKENGDNGVLSMCLKMGVNSLLAPKIDQIEFGGMSQSAVNEVVTKTVDYIPDGMSGFTRNTKRVIDFCLSSLLLVVFSPLFLICYIALKLDDGGPAIYKQERIGRFGRPFMIYKFRSMRTDAEAGGPALYAGDDDPRLTKVGKFLRIHHLDELPQLFNVWKGDMAFVGYRPERKFYIDQIMEHDPRYYYLYQIRPGVTSYSTLKNGYTDTMEKMLRRLEFDLYYLRHRSLWFDIKILWQTFANIIFGKVF